MRVPNGSGPLQLFGLVRRGREDGNPKEQSRCGDSEEKTGLANPEEEAPEDLDLAEGGRLPNSVVFKPNSIQLVLVRLP